jgi:hypothetical protein
VSDPVALLCARARETSVATARLLEAIVAVADGTRPGYDADEVAFALAWTQSAARSQVEFGRYLIRVLPQVFAALASGAVDVRRAWVFCDVLAPVDESVAAAIAGAILPHAGELTTSQLRDRLRRAVLKADPDAAARTAKSVADRHIACQPDREGTASLFGVGLPAARATAAFERVDAFARGRNRDGDDRTMDQLRADTFLDLLEGVGVGCSPVHRAGIIELTVPCTTATGATNDPAILAGHGPIDADTARNIIAAHPSPRWAHPVAAHAHRRRRRAAEYHITSSTRWPTPAGVAEQSDVLRFTRHRDTVATFLVAAPWATTRRNTPHANAPAADRARPDATLSRQPTDQMDRDP